MTQEQLNTYHEQEVLRVGSLYCSKHKPGFANKQALQSWFLDQLKKQNYRCYYCETSIFIIQGLINGGKLLPRKTGYGIRGPVLEIDKMQNDLGYSPDNCVLSCLYCNNDKSSILDSKIYKQFFGKSRKSFFEYLLNQL